MGMVYGSINYTTSGRKKRINRKRQVNASFSHRTANTQARSNSDSYRRETTNYPSASDAIAQVAAKQESPQYTGSLVKGIGTMHKSNAVPIIDEQHMKDIARMRR